MSSNVDPDADSFALYPIIRDIPTYKGCEECLYACNRSHHEYRWIPEDHGEDRRSKPGSRECKDK